MESERSVMKDLAAIDGADPAEIGRLGSAIGRLLPTLDAFLEFRDTDRAVTDRARWQAVLDIPLPEAGAGLETVLAELAESIVPYGLRTPHPGFSGYIIGRATTAGIAAGVSAMVASHFRYFLTSFNFLEQLALDWLAELCGIRPGSAGVFSGGGSTANLIALGAARQAAFEAIGVDPSADGLPAGTISRIYGGAEVHHTVHRAAGVLGLGRNSFTVVDSDAAGRVDPAALDRRLRADRGQGILPLAIVAIAGSTSTGAIDPMAAVADVARDHGVWLHVDGAYGLPAHCLPELAEAFRGVERADSAIVDPHKWLGTPVGCAATYVRDRSLLHRAFQQEPAPYLEAQSPEQPSSQFDDHGPHWYDQSVELHAPARGVLLWATLREIGVDGVRQRLRRHIGFAHRLADTVRNHDRLELLLEPELSICCFRYRPQAIDEGTVDKLNEEIIRLLRAETSFVPSSTRIEGKLAIRPCFVNAATTLADVDGLAEAVVALGDRLSVPAAA
jgi:aromatic-L-amino-acid decarboxylase